MTTVSFFGGASSSSAFFNSISQSGREKGGMFVGAKILSRGKRQSKKCHRQKNSSHPIQRGSFCPVLLSLADNFVSLASAAAQQTQTYPPQKKTAGREGKFGPKEKPGEGKREKGRAHISCGKKGLQIGKTKKNLLVRIRTSDPMRY